MPAPMAAEPGPVYEQYRDDVYAWAYRLVGQHHDALDVAQDVFVSWCTQAARTPPDHPRGWLRRVTINRAIDLLRARRPAAADVAVVEPAIADDTSQRAETQELRAALAGAIERLTEAQRGVLIAKVYDGLTFAQIAAELNLAVPTVKTHYLRALSAVRSHLSTTAIPKGSHA